jgi:hypothetical protein
MTQDDALKHFVRWGHFDQAKAHKEAAKALADVLKHYEHCRHGSPDNMCDCYKVARQALVWARVAGLTE